MFDLIKDLTEFIGPIGQEGEIIAHVEQLWQSAGLKTGRTRIGNLLGRAGGSGKKLLLAAHADAKGKAEALVAEEMKSVTGGLTLPPGMQLPF